MHHSSAVRDTDSVRQRQRQHSSATRPAKKYHTSSIVEMQRKAAEENLLRHSPGRPNFRAVWMPAQRGQSRLQASCGGGGRLCSCKQICCDAGCRAAVDGAMELWPKLGRPLRRATPGGPSASGRPSPSMVCRGVCHAVCRALAGRTLTHGPRPPPATQSASRIRYRPIPPGGGFPREGIQNA